MAWDNPGDNFQATPQTWNVQLRILSLLPLLLRHVLSRASAHQFQYFQHLFNLQSQLQLWPLLWAGHGPINHTHQLPPLSGVTAVYSRVSSCQSRGGSEGNHCVGRECKERYLDLSTVQWSLQRSIHCSLWGECDWCRVWLAKSLWGGCGVRVAKSLWGWVWLVYWS